MKPFNFYMCYLCPVNARESKELKSLVAGIKEGEPRIPSLFLSWVTGWMREYPEDGTGLWAVGRLKGDC